MHKYGMLWEEFCVFGLTSSEMLPPPLQNVFCHAGALKITITDTESTECLRFEKQEDIAVVVTIRIATKPFVAKATQSFFTKRVTFLYAI